MWRRGNLSQDEGKSDSGAQSIALRRAMPDGPLADGRLLTQTSAVNIARIKERLENGFRPFELRLTNGRKVPIPHSEFIAIAPGTVGVLGEKGSVTIIDPLHIASLKDLPATSPGRGRRRKGGV